MIAAHTDVDRVEKWCATHKGDFRTRAKTHITKTLSKGAANSNFRYRDCASLFHVVKRHMLYHTVTPRYLETVFALLCEKSRTCGGSIVFEFDFE